MPLLLSLWLLAQPQAIPEARLTHAQSQTRALTGSLDQDFRSLVQAQSGPAWIGYVVSRAPRGGDTCLWDQQAPPRPVVMLEGARHAVILYRIERREVVRIRAYAIDCEFDAGDLPFYWLTGVRPEDSIRLLDTFTQGNDTLRQVQMLASSAIYAIGAHSEPNALDLLIAKARNDKSRTVRRAAFSAIGRLQDPKAFAFLEEILRR
jgi:hypothetical protein